MSSARRKRTEKRKANRAHDDLARDRERLFLLEPGGSPARPVAVATASIVESRCTRFECPNCAAALRAAEHRAVTEQGRRLREVRARCTGCGQTRSLWFEVVAPSLN